MATFRMNNKNNEIEISFESKPQSSIRDELKANDFKWDSSNEFWHGEYTEAHKQLAEDICGVQGYQPYGLKLKLKNIVQSSDTQVEEWIATLKTYINKLIPPKNKKKPKKNDSQENAWKDCFSFIREQLASLPDPEQEFELVFEYSLPETYHRRPDVLLLTNNKVVCLEFKNKKAPQRDDSRDDIAQIHRYEEFIRHHHKATQDYEMDVKAYLVCTQAKHPLKSEGNIKVLTQNDFKREIEKLLSDEVPCSFADNWLSSSRVEEPDMLRAVRYLYRTGEIPYVSDANLKTIEAVQNDIDEAKTKQKKRLIFINGIPGSGKTAVAQIITFKENKHGEANAVYLAGNGALVEVLQYEIDSAGNIKGIGENVIQSMKKFSEEYFDNSKIPQQSVIVFDEAQRAWDSEKYQKRLSQPMELFNVGDRIAEKNHYAVIVALYGDGQFVESGEEKSLALWSEAIKQHPDWDIVVSDKLASDFADVKERRKIDYDMYLSTALRADFINYTKWVEQAIERRNVSFYEARNELKILKDTSFRVLITRDLKKIKERADDYYKEEHPEWNYGFLMSNYADKNVVKKSLKDWNAWDQPFPNGVYFGQYGEWYTSECKKLDQSCSVYGNQGLELDCPIVIFGGDYIRKDKQWTPSGWAYEKEKDSKEKNKLFATMENNYRILLTRARKELILFLPKDPSLNETYDYFVDMGVDIL